MPCFGARSQQSPPDAFPWRQMAVLSLCRLCEPIAFMSIFPYSYYMIESFHVTNDRRQIAMFAGLVTSVFAFAECICGWAWGRLSDRIGRKPVLLTGIAGTGLSMILFGFAPNLQWALFARALGGLLNGNIGVINSVVGEIIPEKHQALGYTVMPTVWCIGSIIGSALGGALADPARNFSGAFWHKPILEAFPYLLPNIVCALVVLLGMVVGILFLEETHPQLREHTDIGIQLGRRLLRPFQRVQMEDISSAKGGYDQATLALLHDEDLPDYRSTASSPELSPTYAPNGLPPPAYQSIEGSRRSSLSTPRPELDVLDTERTRSRVPSVFTKQVSMIILEYGLLAYHTISAEQLLPVLLSMPESETSPALPFKFTGGFGWPTKKIGAILSAQGLIQIFVTLVLFPKVQRRLGSLWTFRLTALSYPFLYLMVPYVTLVPAGWWRIPLITFVLVWKVTAQAWTFPSLQIMLNNSTPKQALGTVNGCYASSASLSRAIGPTFSGFLQSTGLSIGVLGLPWWTIALAVALPGATLSFFFREERRVYDCEKQHEDSDDAGLASPVLYANEVNAALAVAESSNSPNSIVQIRPESPLLTRLTLDRNARRDSKS